MIVLYNAVAGACAEQKANAGGGGGGGGGISPGTKLISITSKTPPVTNHSQIGLEIEDMSAGAFFQDPTSGALIRGALVSDYVAHTNSVSGVSNALTNGTATLNVGNEYELRPVAFYSAASSASPTGTEVLTVSVIQDTGNNVSSGHIGINSLNIAGGHSFNLTAPYRPPFGNAPNFIGNIEIGSSASAGTLIFKLHITGGTTDTDSNVIAQSASTSDSYYLRVILA